MEKVFEISFTMPQYSSLLKLISQYFDDSEINSVNGKFHTQEESKTI